MSQYQRHDLRVTSICVEGQVMVVAHSAVGKGGGLDMMQPQHEKNGRIVPVRCGPEGARVSQEPVGERPLENQSEAAGG